MTSLLVILVSVLFIAIIFLTIAFKDIVSLQKRIQSLESAQTDYWVSRQLQTIHNKLWTIEYEFLPRIRKDLDSSEAFNEAVMNHFNLEFVDKVEQTQFVPYVVPKGIK